MTATKDLKATVYTLGCRLNQSESSIMEKGLEKRGYTMTDFKDSSDLVIINTCTVTAKADADCRNVIRNYSKRNPEAFVAVVGCYSQMGYKALSKIDGIDLIMGNQDKLEVLDYVQLGKNEKPLIIHDKIKRDDFTIENIGQSDSKTRANLKVQDGCDFMCTFCIIPFARGRARSRNMENLMEEAVQLGQQGFKEVILTGVNVGTYDNQGYTVTDIVERINEIDGIERIRISSIEPTTIDEKLFEYMADPEHALVPYLHIPLQAGSDKVLELMKRRYTIKEYSDFINLAAERVPDLCIGTDVMTGMAGEDDDDFQDSADFLINSPVNYFHVFTFSEREGTPAVKMEGKNEKSVKKRRNAVLRKISERKREAFYESYIGREMDVLFEQYAEGFWSGYTENYIRVAVNTGANLENKIVKVKLTETAADFVVGEIVR